MYSEAPSWLLTLPAVTYGCLHAIHCCFICCHGKTFQLFPHLLVSNSYFYEIAFLYFLIDLNPFP